MYKIIVFTHGSLAESLVRTSRLILGNQPDIETYCVEPGCNLEEMRNGVEQSIRRSNDSGQEVLVLTDLMYGTPSLGPLPMRRWHRCWMRCWQEERVPIFPVFTI